MSWFALLAFTILLAGLIALFLSYPPTFLDFIDLFLGSEEQFKAVSINMITTTPVTIRNLTSTAIDFISIQKFDHSLVADVADATAAAANGARAHQSGLTHQNLGKSQEVSITIAPFETVTTDRILDETGSRSTQVRLTFLRKDGDRNEEHLLDIHICKEESKDLAPASEHAKPQLTAVYHPEPSQITIFTLFNPSSWMANLRSDTPISALSIPGTHNAPAYHCAFPSVRCQAVAPRVQLENGIRFFDIRVRVVDPATDKLELVHAIWPVALTGRHWFRTLVDDIFAFLDKNPSETVLMSVKREGLGNASDAELSKVLQEHYAGDASKWFTAPRVPYLGEARGKIVLIRRFGLDISLQGEYGGAGWGLDASAWADNTPDALTGSGDLRVQDFYGVMRSGQIKTKTEYVTGLMAKTSAIVSSLPATATTMPAATQTETLQSNSQTASASEKQPIHVNFLSASNFFNPRCWPEGIAAKLNPRILEYLCLRHNQPDGDQQIDIGDGCTGIVVCDWVGHKGNWDLVRVIVGWNARLIAREQS